jgi:RNase P subunit RPR2
MTRMKDFKITCLNCRSEIVRIIDEMDFELDDWQKETGNIYFKCLDCGAIEFIDVKYKKFL